MSHRRVRRLGTHPGEMRRGAEFVGAGGDRGI